MSTPIHDQLMMMIRSPPFPNDHIKDDQNLVLLFGASSHSQQASISGISSTTTYSLSPAQADHQEGTSTTTAAAAAATELQLTKDYDQQLVHDHHQAANGMYSPCSTDESSDHQQFLPAASSSSDSALLLNNNNYGLLMKSSVQDIQEWRMPLKIRFMRKYSSDQMVAGTHHQESVLIRSDLNRNQEYHPPAAAPAAFDAKNSATTTTMNNIRVCSDCSTTKTPLWRGGPRGPKSLCNACGIRQRKARRAMAAAAAATGTNNIVPEMNSTSPTVCKVQHMKEKKTNKGSFHDQTTSVANKQEKKQRNKLMMNSCSSGSSTASCSSGKKKQKQQEKLCFEDWVISLSENGSDFHSVFPQDEKEAAILLMALSCGLVYG